MANNMGETTIKISIIIREGVSLLHQREEASLRLVKETLPRATCRNMVAQMGSMVLDLHKIGMWAASSDARFVKSKVMMLSNAATDSIIAFKPKIFLRC